MHLILRGGAVVARWAHNPKVGGSNPPSATKKKPWCESTGVFYFQPEPQTLASGEGMEIKNPDRRRRRMQGFFFGLLPKTDHRIILPPLQRKSPGAKAPGFFILQPEDANAVCRRRDGNKKPPQTPKADAGLFLWAVSQNGS